MKYIKIICILFVCTLLGSQNFTAPKKKKELKKTPHDCCQEIMRQMQSFAHIIQYCGCIEAIELQWVQDFFDAEDGIFARATPAQLQKYMEYKRKSNAAREAYEDELRQECNFLKQFEQEVRASKTKK